MVKHGNTLQAISSRAIDKGQIIMVVNWGAYMQPGFGQEIDQLGSELSLVIDCPVHYPAFGKNLFECHCGVVFPLYLVKGKNWELIKRKHDEEKVYARR